MEPIFTNDAVVLGLLMLVLAFVFKTSGSDSAGWKKFYTYIPALLCCYFLPALLHWPLGLISAHWYDTSALMKYLTDLGHQVPSGLSYNEMQTWIGDNGIEGTKQFEGHSRLYFVASRYLLPASLILLCLSIDLKSVWNLGPKALIMFITATIGVVIGGPVALLVVENIAPNIVPVTSDELWRGLATVAGSWIGGGANQTAMKEIFEVGDNLFATMIIVDVVVANIWMGFLLYGANVSDKIDRRLKADNSSIETLKTNMENYQARVSKIPTTTDSFILMAVAFGGVAFAHFGADFITKTLLTDGMRASLASANLHSLMSHFFWLIVIVTTLGIAISFTRLRALEGVGASRWGSVFIYILVATIGMKMDLGEVWANLGLFAIGIVWMLVHVSLLLFVAWLIKAPFFFVAVGSQANIGGAASAPIVASAFSPALAPVGVLLAVLGYALGTYFAIVCALLMQGVAG